MDAGATHPHEVVEVRGVSDGATCGTWLGTEEAELAPLVHVFSRKRANEGFGVVPREGT